MSADNEVAIVKISGELFGVAHLVSYYPDWSESDTYAQATKVCREIYPSRDEAKARAKEMVGELMVCEHGITFYDLDELKKMYLKKEKII